jgi:hypothetical protein
MHGEQAFAPTALRLQIGSDPLNFIHCVEILDLCFGSSTYTLSKCAAVSKSWRAAVQCIRNELRRVAISAADDPWLIRTSDRIVERVLASAIRELTELRLHGLVLLSDSALSPLLHCHSLRLASFMYCTKLTTLVKYNLPRSTRELHIAGCARMYGDLVCEAGLHAVEEQSLSGFRFVDPALRAGIRQGPACACKCGGCVAIADRNGRPAVQQVWHASSFDWCDH